MSLLLIHKIPAAWGLPSVGPFCLKLEVYLRMAGLPYESTVDATPFGAPKGKLPWLEHEGKKIADSGFIIDYLERRFGLDGNAGLCAADHAIAHALRRLIEENLYWTMVYDRWMIKENWLITRKVILGQIPILIRKVVEPLARRGVRRQLESQGIGRHSTDEIHEIGKKDIRAIADFLADKPFLMGGSPSQIDAIAYGFLANIMKVPVESPIKREALARPNLVDYLKRIEKNFLSGEVTAMNASGNPAGLEGPIKQA